jgi:hypothetical protein
MAQNDMATGSDGKSTSTEHPASLPNGSGQPKVWTRDDLKRDPSLWAALKETFGTSHGGLGIQLLVQVTSAVPNVEPFDANADHTLAALRGIGPRDTVEGLLATQMVAVHNQAMEFRRRAALPGQPPAGVELNVNLATKSERTFLAQLDALDRHRSKGAQKMNVEHVHIHGGAQGVVGSVNHQQPADASVEDHGKSN